MKKEKICIIYVMCADELSYFNSLVNSKVDQIDNENSTATATKFVQLKLSDQNLSVHICSTNSKKQAKNHIIHPPDNTFLNQIQILLIVVLGNLGGEKKKEKINKNFGRNCKKFMVLNNFISNLIEKSI